MVEVQLRIVGPDRFCPECHRWLVHVHDDGRFDLAGRSSMVVNSPLEEIGVGGGYSWVDSFLVEATCLRRGCRARRWFGREWAALAVWLSRPHTPSDEKGPV